MKKKNLCPRCKGKKKIARRNVRSGRKTIIVCPDCNGIGKRCWSPDECRKVGYQLLAKVLEENIDSGFHIRHVGEHNFESVHDAMEMIVEELRKKGTIEGVND